MKRLWTLGGLRWHELAKRTWSECWEDEVFGLAARLAFYHFLALFPVLLLVLFFLLKLAGPGSELRHTLTDSLDQLLPHQASQLLGSMINQLNRTAGLGIGVWWAILSSTWAAVNGTWALMTGLNMAYEVREKRRWWNLLLRALVLTICLAVLALISLALILYGSRAVQLAGPHVGISAGASLFWRLVQWPVIIVLLLTAFAILYRFAPNLDDREWQWSTPGAVVALVLWVGAALLLKAYFERFSAYERLYGPLANVAMLLMWLYLTSAAILIGGELNSEIEKAAEGKAGKREAAGRDNGNAAGNNSAKSA